MLNTPEKIEKFRARFEGVPKSVCVCGHTGDGPNSQHRNTYQYGHASCKMCPCKKFTWKGWLPDVATYLQDVLREG